MLNVRRQGAAPLALGLILLFSPAGVSANPDVWVKAASVWHLDRDGMAAVTFEWAFDEYFSSRGIEIYDSNGNRALEPEEIARLRAEVFDPLSRFDYYVHVLVGGERQSDFTVEEFTARIDDSRLVYRFKLLLQTAVDPAAGPLVVSLHDPKTVVDFRFVEERFLLVEGALDPACRFRVERGRGALSGHAQPVTLTCGG